MSQKSRNLVTGEGSMTVRRSAPRGVKDSREVGEVSASLGMRETAKTLAVQRRLKASIARLEQIDPEADLLIEYRVLNARILRDIRKFRANAELALRRARTKAERKAAAEYLHLVVLAESEFASGVELAN